MSEGIEVWEVTDTQIFLAFMNLSSEISNVLNILSQSEISKYGTISHLTTLLFYNISSKELCVCLPDLAEYSKRRLPEFIHSHTFIV